MTVRSLTTQDKTAIASVLNSRRDLAVVGVSWSLDSVLAELSVSSSLGVFASRVDSSEELVSFVLYKELGDILEILLIYSHRQKKGSADQALKALIARYPQAREVWLEVHEANASAIRFYEQQGFVKVSKRSNYYPGGMAAINYNLNIKR